MQRLFRFGLVISILFTCSLLFPMHYCRDNYKVTDRIKKRIVLTYTRTNTGRTTPDAVTIQIAVPKSLPEQVIERVIWSPEPTGYVTDRYGQEIAEFFQDDLKPGENFTVTMDVIAELGRIKYKIDADTVGSFEDIPQDIKDLYTTDAAIYQLNDPLIKETAQNIAQGEKNLYRLAIRIHDFVASTLDYSMEGGWDGAATVLNRRIGSCSEYTFLFIALARTLGIPARYAGGSIYRLSHPIDKEAHRWAEVYLPNYGWIPFDATFDMVRSDKNNPRHDYVGSHPIALVMARGGGTDQKYLREEYRFITHWRGKAQLDRSWQAIWTNP